LVKTKLIPQFAQEEELVLQLTLVHAILDTQEINVKLQFALENQHPIPQFVLGGEVVREWIHVLVILVTQEINVKQ
jgi:hypothetical protein